MKRCPKCNRSYSEAELNFCLADGSQLVLDQSLPGDAATVTQNYPEPRDTNPPPTLMRNSGPYSAGQPALRTPQWMPMSQAPKQSKAVWWVVGVIGVIVVAVIGLAAVGIVIGSLKLAANSTGSPSTNRNRSNSPRPKLPAYFKDDFATQRWSTAPIEHGNLWYAEDQYHMRASENSYILQYAPGNDYNTENATVRVTVHNVDGVSPALGYGLVVHGEKSKEGKLEDYAFLILTGPKPTYRVVLHQGGNESTMVPATPSNVIRSGTNTNQLEARITGDQLAFYINSQYVTSITDTANFKRGVVGFYTSDAHEVAFDDLEITR